MNGAILQKRCNLHPCCEVYHAIDLIPDSLGIIHKRRRHFFDFLTLSSHTSVVFYSFLSAIFYPFFISPPLQNTDVFYERLLTSTRVPKYSADAAWSRRDSLQSEHTRPICMINRQIKLFTRHFRTLKVTLPVHFCYIPVSKRHTGNVFIRRLNWTTLGNFMHTFFDQIRSPMAGWCKATKNWRNLHRWFDGM